MACSMAPWLEGLKLEALKASWLHGLKAASRLLEAFMASWLEGFMTSWRHGFIA